MPEVNHHHDGHGLNDRITVACDARDLERGGNASHHYKVTMPVGEQYADPENPIRVATIDFQHGPRDVEGSRPGITDAVLLAVILDRYEGFQDGPYRCRENAIVITKIQEAMHWRKHRADDRARRGVLGKNEE